MSEPGELTLKDLIEDRRVQHRTMSIHIQGNPNEDPPENRALAVRVASLLTGENGSVIEPGETAAPDELPSQSVLLFTKYDAETWGEWAERTSIQQWLRLARVKEVHIVVHAETVPESVEQLLDVRVYSTGNIVSLEVDAFSEAVHERPLDGLC